jgi:hypothetical protein
VRLPQVLLLVFLGKKKIMGEIGRFQFLLIQYDVISGLNTSFVPGSVSHGLGPSDHCPPQVGSRPREQSSG